MIKTLTNIQALRAFAALSVVLFHVTDIAPRYGYSIPVLGAVHALGAAGVDLFFVISGFIMVYVQNQKHRSPLRFFRDRLVRIVPCYWLLTGLMAALLAALPGAFGEMTYDHRWLASSVVFVSGWSHFRHPVLFVGWTIEYEMAFYVVFAGSLFLGDLGRSLLVSVALLLAFVFVGGGAPVLIEFTFGILIGWLFFKGRFPKSVCLTSLVCGVLAMAATIWFPEAVVLRHWYWGIPAALIVFAVAHLPPINSGVLTQLGDASYSVYLVQAFTLPACYKLAHVLHAPQGHGAVDISVGAVSFLVTALAGLLFHQVVERGLAKRFKALFAGWRAESP